MPAYNSLSESEPARRVKLITTIVFAFVGALSPIGVALYEHRFHLLPIRTIEILWPSSLVFFPDPTRRFPILISSLSIALNAFIYGLAGLVLGALVDVFRGRHASATHT
ncbi:MAG TPA: hypothetical protein VMJ93_16575 [Verrucomicrobiae bacterium]|nr:hypothetical protein [Verrucomicrobiae bacterium]